jgi:glycosyltransferase involved in cell wall biosynthesis
VVAADLDTLPSALTIAKKQRALCVYDSHEYWKGNFAAVPWAFEFWANWESKLVGLCDICSTVSSPLAAQLQREYGTPFISVPNCEFVSAAPVKPYAFVDTSTYRGDAVIFLFQGHFHPERQIAKLITDWPRTDERAILWLRGPDWSYRQELIKLAKSTGLFGKRVFFPEAVDEADLIPAAAQAHVGIIPYDPAVHFGYRFACPNKLSQYLAAGLAILTTDIEYVQSIVAENSLGRVFSLREPGSFVRQVDELARDRAQRAAYSAAGHRFFLEKFNWEAVSQPLYRRIADQLSARARDSTILRPEPRLDWVVNAERPQSIFVQPETVFAIKRPAEAATTVQLAAFSVARRAWKSLPDPLKEKLRPVMRQLFTMR